MTYYSKHSNPGAVLQDILLRRAVIFGALIFLALLAFELFNYSTTEFALRDVIGELHFFGVQWSTILALAFCCIDFAGVAHLFTPQHGADEPTEVWYLFAAWLLAAAMNALLTWWGISVAIVNHQSMGGAVIAQATLLKTVPVFIAIMVWLTRVLIIGTFSIAGERLFGLLAARQKRSRRTRPTSQVVQPLSYAKSINSKNNYRPAPKPPSEPEPTYGLPEPTYHSISASPHSSNTVARR